MSNLYTMKKWILSLIVTVLSNFLFSQTLVKPGYYLVFFKDKNDTTYSLDHPEKFLSQRAIERRTKFHIPITTQDLPVSGTYVKALRDSGYNVIYTSKWLNAALIKESDTAKLNKIKTFPFIDTLGLSKFRHPKDSTAQQVKYNVEIDSSVFPKHWRSPYKYGIARLQNKLIDIPLMHSLGYDGDGVIIAMLDAGFDNVDSIQVFSHLWENHKILGYYDFVDMDTTVFGPQTHGLMALSTIAAKSNRFTGTAPNASFYLFRTEDEDSEYPIEEVNWVVAAEKADSAGVDIISSSLGYQTFDDSTLNYTYKNMNGNYAISTIAADIAASKGIIVVISAGNSGDEQWHYIDAPADGDSVVAVGATNAIGDPAYFSSYGPSYDGRVKPDVAADGSWLAVIGENGYPTISSGTSFSAPTIAGALACLRQAHPNKTNMEIIRALQMSGDHASNPDDRVGYGVPDIYIAHLILQRYDLKDFDPQIDKIIIRPNDAGDTTSVKQQSSLSNQTTQNN